MEPRHLFKRQTTFDFEDEMSGITYCVTVEVDTDTEDCVLLEATQYLEELGFTEVAVDPDTIKHLHGDIFDEAIDIALQTF